MSGRYGTPFQESEIVLAVSVEDYDHAKDILRRMLPGERETFERQLKKTIDLAEVVDEEEA